MSKKLEKIIRKIKVFLGIICECGSNETIEYGYYGYRRCLKCGKKR